MRDRPDLKFAFFGSDDFSVAVLDELKQEDLLPSLIVAPPDRKVGRGLVLTPPPIKLWAQKNKIEILQPEKLDSDFAGQLSNVNCQLFVVASYGKILPSPLLKLPEFGILNVHPSLLPKYRGPSPIESQILNDEKEVGVSVIFLDEEVDHGPVLGEERLIKNAMPMPAFVLTKILAALGGRLLARVILPFLSGELKPVPQDHSKATFTRKISREDGLIDLSNDPYKNYLKFLAFDTWPGVYFFAERKGVKTRVKITDAQFAEGELRVKKVIPESDREMFYEDFLRGS